MNNNTKARNLRRSKELRKQGFPKPIFKKKSKPFPRPNKEDDVSLRAQSLAYHGKCSAFAKV